MNKKILLGVAVLLVAGLACSAGSLGTNAVIGSGNVVGQVRTVPDFTSVELAGSADVNILLGDSLSVNVQSDDNIVPLIETTVANGRLTISTKPFTSITPSNGVVVTVAMRSLQRLTLSGSGNMRVAAMSGPQLNIELPGSGDISVEGAADRVSISMPGSGNVQCANLKAHAVDATLQGSGTISVYADQNLNASVPGSGTIHYDGNPPQVTKTITGSGAITP